MQYISSSNWTDQEKIDFFDQIPNFSQSFFRSFEDGEAYFIGVNSCGFAIYQDPNSSKQCFKFLFPTIEASTLSQEDKIQVLISVLSVSNFSSSNDTFIFVHKEFDKDFVSIFYLLRNLFRHLVPIMYNEYPVYFREKLQKFCEQNHQSITKYQGFLLSQFWSDLRTFTIVYNCIICK